MERSTPVTGNAVVYSTALPVFCTVIPASIRRRIPRLYLFHRSWKPDSSSSVALRALTSSSDPDLACHSPISTSSSSRSDISTSEDTATPVAKYESESGLRWNRVVPAFNLLRNAGYEAQQSHPDSRLVRSLYVNALVYLLDALPVDLTHEEATSIRHRLPERIKSTLPEQEQPHPETGSETRSAGFRAPSDRRSYLHRLLASTIVQLFLLVQFLLPYAKILLHQIYQYERSHRIAERVVTATLDAADSLGKGSLNLGSTVLGLNEGRVAAVVSNFAAWLVEGIAGGVYEGVGEGLVMLGVIRPNFELDKMSMY